MRLQEGFLLMQLKPQYKKGQSSAEALQSLGCISLTKSGLCAVAHCCNSILATVRAELSLNITI